MKPEEKMKPLKKMWDETDVFLILGIVLAIGGAGYHVVDAGLFLLLGWAYL